MILAISTDSRVYLTMDREVTSGGCRDAHVRQADRQIPEAHFVDSEIVSHKKPVAAGFSHKEGNDQ